MAVTVLLFSQVNEGMIAGNCLAWLQFAMLSIGCSKARLRGHSTAKYVPVKRYIVIATV